jgi:hypothetical protein
MSCDPVAPTVMPPVVPSTPTEVKDTSSSIDIPDNTSPTEDQVTTTGEAYFFKDSIEVLGEGFEFRKHVSYGRVLILFDDDGKIVKVETMESLPFKQIDKNTIYLLRGANLTMISRHFGIPIERLIHCNAEIRNPDHIPALTRLKLNCSCEK